MGPHGPCRRRLLTSTVLLPLLLLLSSPSHTAVATAAVDSSPLDVPPSRGEDGGVNLVKNWFRSLSQDDSDDETYEPEFGAFDRSIIGRAPPGVTSLANNVPEQLNVLPGATQVFVFEKATIFGRGVEDDFGAESDVELRRRAGLDDGEGEEGEQERENVQASLEDGGAADDGNGQPRLSRRQSGGGSAKTIYLSANTCIQPQLLSATITGQAPQLTMYVSTSPENIAPGPNAKPDQQTWHVFEEGAAMASVNATGDVYVGITAPNISTTMLSGMYNFQIAASVDAWYHSYDNETDANLIWVDSDASAALLITHNLTDSTDAQVDEAIMDTAHPPYVMFAQNQDDLRSIDGMRFSYCGLQTYAQIAATKNGKFTSMVTTGMTTVGLGDLPKQQFYFSGLNASSNYVGILAALPTVNGTAASANTTDGGPNGTFAGYVAPQVLEVGTSGVIGGGGKVARATSFSTKGANANCEVVFNLTFCDETAYAVPSNPSKFPNSTALAQAYDAYAADMYGIFQNVLAQIACEAPSTQQYSLARSCADCAAAYKSWLCSVAIPRCADFSDNSSFLQPRALSYPFPSGAILDPAVAAQFPNISAFNSSRNPFIDETIAPGPYKEVLPCEDLCYNLVQSCPASIGFSCPRPGYLGFNTSYGVRTAADSDGSVTCNYPGSAHFFSAGPAGPRLSWMPLAVAAAGTFVMLLL